MPPRPRPGIFLSAVHQRPGFLEAQEQHHQASGDQIPVEGHEAPDHDHRGGGDRAQPGIQQRRAGHLGAFLGLLVRLLFAALEFIAAAAAMSMGFGTMMGTPVTEAEADARANEIAQRWGDSLDVIERLLVTHREIICQMMPRTNNLNK